MAQIAELAGNYEIILADPPWRYQQNHSNLRGGMSYPTMTDDELAALSPPGAANSMLLLWATTSRLDSAMKIMAAWGYEFVTVLFVWVKTAPDGQPCMGLGHYTRSNAELLLLGRRGGGLTKWVVDHSVKQVFMAQRRQHSRKPDEIFDLIDRLLGTGHSRLEMFAREPRPGWDCWGNDCNHFDQK